MSGRFAAEWLMLREAADLAARNNSLQARLAGLLPGRRTAGISVLDLGAGTGANLRALAPALGPGQHWSLLDHDAELLEYALSSLMQWGRDAGYTVHEGGEDLRLESAGWDARITLRQCDLSGEELDALPVPGLVTASALLDLVSADWLKRLAYALPGAVLYFP
ncbi:methyltransferase domain-containing protein [Fodinicurvata halophila]